MKVIKKLEAYNVFYRKTHKYVALHDASDKKRKISNGVSKD